MAAVLATATIGARVLAAPAASIAADIDSPGALLARDGNGISFGDVSPSGDAFPFAGFVRSRVCEPAGAAQGRYPAGSALRSLPNLHFQADSRRPSRRPVSPGPLEAACNGCGREPPCDFQPWSINVRRAKAMGAGATR